MAQRRTGFFIASALAACLGASGGTAQAQFGGQAGFADAFRIDFLERDLPLFVETLKLEEWQRPIVESLLQDYQLSFTAGVEQVREQMRASTEQIAASREDDVMKIILKPLDAWDEKRIQYRDDFLQNVKAQLSSDQLGRWPHFERTLRRDKSLSKGELMGESIDLFIVVRNMRMPFEIEQSVDPLLMEYELELDGALKSRQQVMESLQDKVKDAMASMDFDAGLSAMDQIMTTRIRIRELQDAYINRLAEALPEEWSEKFRQTALGKSYPKVFRPNPIDKMLESARQSPDLTESQLAELDSIEIDFHAQLSALEQRLLQAYRISEPNNPRLKVQRMLDRRDGRRTQNEPSEMDKISAERNDLISETRRKILAVLTPEQIGAMPGSSERPRDGQIQNGRRSRLPMGGPDPEGVATPTFRDKQPPAFGTHDESMGDGEGPSKIDPSSKGKSSPKS